MGIIVQKFGGSSVADLGRVQHVARRVVDTVSQGNQVVVVVSAQGDTTDELIALAREYSPRPPKRELDMLLSTGEQQSAALVSMAINALGYDAVSLTGPQSGILTNSSHTKAKINQVDGARILHEIGQGKVVVVAGFQGVTANNDITTLGRGGSDTTAVAVASAINADVCEIYTDVDGVYTADPRIVPKARKISVMDYCEMLEFASLGALVLQPRSVEFAATEHVTIHVRSTFSNEEGTTIREVNDVERENIVTGVTSDHDCAKVTLVGITNNTKALCDVFSLLALENINVDMIVHANKGENTTDLTFTVSRSDLTQTVELLNGASLRARAILTDEDVAKVSIVGAGMMSNPGVAAAMFEALNSQGIPIQLISTSEIKVSCLIPRKMVNEAVQACHAKFQLDGE